MADADFVTAVNLTGTSAYTGGAGQGVGMSWTNTSGASVVITQLGRWVVSGNSLTHQVGIYTTNNISSLVASVTVTTAGQPAGAFVFNTLGTPYTVTNGATIYIISLESSTDQFMGVGTTYPGLTTPGIGTTASAGLSGSTINTFGNSSRTYSAFGPVSFRFSSPSIPGWTKAGTTYDTNGYPYAVTSAIADASPGDTIQLPTSGAFTWGSGGSSITLNKAVTLDGRGTTITIAPTAPTFGTGTIVNSGGARITNIIFQQPSSSTTTAISMITTAGGRVDHCTYNGVTTGFPGYFIYASVYGLADHNTINTLTGGDEYLFVRGPTNSWTSANSIGTASAFFFENNTINGPGYTDFNANARVVDRFNTRTGASKTDGHGYSTNQNPYIGVRHVEVYNDTWTYGGSHTSVEMRGGLVIAFNNNATNSGAGLTLFDYGYDQSATNWGKYQTPLNYPLFNQIGTGQMVVINATALVPYQRAVINTLNDGVGGANTDFTLIGASSNTVNSSFFNLAAQFTATGPGTGTGTVLVAPASEKSYLFLNTRNGSVWPINTGNVASGAITEYRSQTGNPSATFTSSQIIQSNRDYFADAGSAANTGVTVGTVIGSAPSAVGKTNQGYWAADEGTWNTQNNQVGTPGYQKGQGRLYVSNGTTWNLAYEPYTYPHPLQGTFPSVISATIDSTGNTLTLGLSESCTTGSGGAGGFILSASAGAVTVNLPPAGSGSSSYAYPLSRPIRAGETVTVSYTQPGNGIESTSSGADMPSFSGYAVTNGSTVNGLQSGTLRKAAAIGGGF